MFNLSFSRCLIRGITTYSENISHKPWNYKKYGFSRVNSLFDRTSKRMNENSKIIIICGNIGIGKGQFSRKFADSFNLHYMDDVDHDKEGLVLPNGLNLRQFDERLPLHLRTYSLEDWFKDSNPGIKASKIQLGLFDLRIRQYADSMAHLLNTGQGVVINRSIWSDLPFAYALHSCGLISDNAFQYYKYIASQSLCSLPHPHLTIFLNCSPEVTMGLIANNRPKYELTSGLLTLKLVESIHQSYLETVLPLMRKYGQVLEIDWEDYLKHKDKDFEIKMLASDVEKIDLDDFDIADPHLFRDWRTVDETMLRNYRIKFTDPEFCRMSLVDEIPWDCEELRPNEADYDLWHNVVKSDHRFNRSKRYIEYPSQKSSFFRLEL